MKIYCPVLPKESCPNVLDNFPGITNEACQSLGELETRANDQVLFDISYRDFINSNGQYVHYYCLDYDMERSDIVHAEDLVAGYNAPYQIKGYFEVQDVPAELANLGGFYSNDTVKILFHIKDFKTAIEKQEWWKSQWRPEPKINDVIQLIGYGCDRPGDRGANYFKITGKEDQMLSSNSRNPAFGHYVWSVFAKRLKYSQEEGLETTNGESANQQVYLQDQAGKLLSDLGDTLTEPKSYDGDIDETVMKEVYPQNKRNRSDVYGGF